MLRDDSFANNIDTPNAKQALIDDNDLARVKLQILKGNIKKRFVSINFKQRAVLTVTGRKYIAYLVLKVLSFLNTYCLNLPEVLKYLHPAESYCV